MPAGVTSLAVTVVGGAGGEGLPIGSAGAAGAQVDLNAVPVTANQPLYLYVQPQVLRDSRAQLRRAGRRAQNTRRWLDGRL